MLRRIQNNWTKYYSLPILNEKCQINLWPFNYIRITTVKFVRWSFSRNTLICISTATELNRIPPFIQIKNAIAVFVWCTKNHKNIWDSWIDYILAVITFLVLFGKCNFSARFINHFNRGDGYIHFLSLLMLLLYITVWCIQNIFGLVAAPQVTSELSVRSIANSKMPSNYSQISNEFNLVSITCCICYSVNSAHA